MNRKASFKLNGAFYKAATIFALALGAPALLFGQADAKPSAAQGGGSEKSQAAPSAADIKKGKEIVVTGAKAAGGDALKSIKSAQIDTSGQAFAQGGAVDIKLQLTIEYPNRLHTQAELPQGNIQQIFDGTVGWLATSEGTIDLPEEYIPEFKRGIALAGAWGLYRDALAGKVDAHFVDEEQVEGKKVEIVEWASPSGPARLYFDATNHLLTGAHFDALTPEGSVQTDQRWADFRAVSGCQYPYSTTVFHNGQKFTETTVQAIKTNVTVDPAFFTKPKQKEEPQQQESQPQGQSEPKPQR